MSHPWPLGSVGGVTGFADLAFSEHRTGRVNGRRLSIADSAYMKIRWRQHIFRPITDQLSTPSCCWLLYGIPCESTGRLCHRKLVCDWSEKCWRQRIFIYAETTILSLRPLTQFCVQNTLGQQNLWLRPLTREVKDDSQLYYRGPSGAECLILHYS